MSPEKKKIDSKITQELPLVNSIYRSQQSLVSFGIRQTNGCDNLGQQN